LLTACVCFSAGADDGAINNKSMTKTINVPIFAEELINEETPVAEHAFTSMMGFYVPAQQASGAPPDTTSGIIDYYNIDDELVESLPVAKPLVNVFIYGPALEVEGTAFAHSYMDAYGAVSLDDGVTFKKTNLSLSADLSSFDILADHVPGDDEEEPEVLHDDINGGVAHAPGGNFPFSSANHCTECHGKALQGTTQEPSCFSCHSTNYESKFDEPIPDAFDAIVYEAIMSPENEITGKGVNAGTAAVEIVNGATGNLEAVSDDPSNGLFEFAFTPVGEPPCSIAAKEGDYVSPAIAVVNSQGEPIRDCANILTDIGDDETTADEGDGEVVEEEMPYPGGVHNVFHAVAGNKVLVAWPSRFCGQGQPAYSIAWDGDDEGLTEDQLAKRNALVDLLDIDLEEDLYLTDLFGVAGAQGSIDFADEGYPQAGVVPFGCVWTARGILLPGDDLKTEDVVETSYMVWTKAERLTSGRRDPNRIEVQGVAGAGFVITWQEDPDGLRPGQGEGPGEGWSGAVAHDKTDIWYSFIPWAYFDLLEDPAAPAGEPIVAEAFDLSLTGRPQAYVPMAVPMRMTNNDKCVAETYSKDARKDLAEDDAKYFSYCNADVADDYGLQDFCADTIEVPQGPQGELGAICVNEDGLPNIANTASTRARTSLQGYDADGDGITERAWVIVAAEESKGLGRYAFLPDGTPCDEDTSDDPDCTADIGKNQWYFSFDMGDPATSDTDDKEYGLVQNLVSQGNLLNQPEVDWRTGEFYPAVNTDDMWDFDNYDFDIYNTEIARRSSLLVQSIAKAIGSQSGVLATPSWKQGTMRQGGPADVMLRRIGLTGEDCGRPAIPDSLTPVCQLLKNDKENQIFLAEEAIEAFLAKNEGSYVGWCTVHQDCNFVATIENNPYAFTNMDCTLPDGGDGWILTDGKNPYYPNGICTAPAVNLSGVIPDTCSADSDTGVATCPTVDFSSSTFGIGDTNPILQGYTQGEGNTTRVLTWHQCPSEATQVSGDTTVTCDTDLRTDPFANLADQSWYNPLDVSKGHRGFIDGDFVMFLYAWSPNWRLNAKGNDRYELYIRRSFDGGQTWGTLPSSFLASNGESYSGDGTVTCESYRTPQSVSSTEEPVACFSFPAGGAEHARNVTQHKAMRITTLDPRYSATRGSITATCLDGLGLTDTTGWSCDDTSAVQDTDLRNPSRYFIAFETGDNTTVAVGEAEPLNLYYGRAESFGDDYTVWTETEADASLCYPSDAHGVDVDDAIVDSGFCNEFDRMNTGTSSEASEASLTANPDGSKMYGVWAQWRLVSDTAEDESDELEPGDHVSDAMARRVWWIDDYVSDTEAYTLPGTSTTQP